VTHRTLTETDMWHAIERRDRSAEGQFWLGVLTTGVFCRPGCPARTPLRKNVVFFDSLQQALRSGLRPCKRCRPLGTSIDQERAAIIGEACTVMLDTDTPPSLDELAHQAGMSASHFQKLFSTVVGLTPAQFARSVREQRLHRQLPVADSVIRAGLDAGYASNTQLYADAPEALGMSPGRFRNKGKGETIHHAVIETWLGPTLIAATPRGICRLRFGDDESEMIAALESDFANATIAPADDAFRELVDQVVKSLGTPDALNLPLDIRGTAFQMKVWHALRQIPFGSTVSYGELAEQIAQPTASRAVASACGSNDIAVLIPCHRVIGKDGTLTGYRWGVERKRKLLESEKVG
jgi:AraC family transcriptional regulator of adaptative response/methylated-DNA-[protein]-cysteine methyltransferase